MTSTVRRAGQLGVVGLAIAIDLVAWGGDRELRGGSLMPALVIPAVTVVAYSALLFRQQRPWTVFAGQWAFALISIPVPLFQPFAGLMIALHAVASRVSLGRSLLALGLVAGVFAVHSINSADRRWTSVLQLLILWLVLATAVWGVGRLSYVSARRAWRQRELQAAEAAESLRSERARLARELHDTITHGVTSMLLHAAVAQSAVDDPPRVRSSLETIERSGVRTMTELHRVLGLLHSVEQDDSAQAPHPTIADIGELVALAVEAGRAVTLTHHGTARTLDADLETVAYRVVQESLTNSLKHAGPGATVLVDLGWSTDGLVVEVTDHGSAGPAAVDVAMLSSGHGLSGLRTRVREVGGHLTTGPVPGGFQVRAGLPTGAPTTSQAIRP